MIGSLTWSMMFLAHILIVKFVDFANAQPKICWPEIVGYPVNGFNHIEVSFVSDVETPLMPLYKNKTQAVCDFFWVGRGFKYLFMHDKNHSLIQLPTVGQTGESTLLQVYSGALDSCT
jgi:hypothetical protein